MPVDGAEEVEELFVPVAAGALLPELPESIELQAARPSTANAPAAILKEVITHSSIATVRSPSGHQPRG